MIEILAFILSLLTGLTLLLAIAYLLILSIKRADYIKRGFLPARITIKPKETEYATIYRGFVTIGTYNYLKGNPRSQTISLYGYWKTYTFRVEDIYNWEVKLMK